MSIPGSLSQAVTTARAPYVIRLEQTIPETVSVPLYKQGGSAPTLDTGYTAILSMSKHRGGSGLVSVTADSVSETLETATFSFTATHVSLPSLMVGRILIKNAAGTATDRLTCFVEVKADVLTSNTDFPVSIDDVRAHIQDRAAGDNRVLDDYEFEDGEIAQAIMSAIDHWNEVSHPGMPLYTATNFPYREQLISASVGRAYLNKAQNLQRNRLPSLGEGMQVDDVGPRIELYMQDGAKRWEEWRAFTMARIRMYRYSQWLGSSVSPYY